MIFEKNLFCSYQDIHSNVPTFLHLIFMDLQNTGIKAFHSKKILPNNQFLSIQDRLIQRFHIPVYKLGDNNDMLSLYETIVDFYAEGE